MRKHARPTTVLVTSLLIIGVVGMSSRDAMAFAFPAASSPVDAPAATIKWALKPAPHPAAPGLDEGLSGISCVSATACIAVGAYGTSDVNADDIPLAEAWDGLHWRQQSLPLPPDIEGYVGGGLTDVSCVSATACTAVGDYYDNAADVQTYVPLAEAWNGTSWAIQPTPTPAGMDFSLLSKVSCASATACLAVGYSQDTIGNVFAFVERWRAGKWKPLTVPNAGAVNVEDVACVTATSCTASGSISAGTGFKALVEQWNGTEWTVQTTPKSGSSSVDAVSCVTTSDCTALGSPAPRPWSSTGTARTGGSNPARLRRGSPTCPSRRPRAHPRAHASA